MKVVLIFLGLVSSNLVDAGRPQRLNSVSALQFGPPPTRTGPELTNVDGGTDLAACEGPCTDDEDCSGELKCFSRDARYPGTDIRGRVHPGMAGFSTRTAQMYVPGCSGDGDLGVSYCYNASGSKTLDEEHDNGGTNLEECQGDCTDDSSCKGSLKCFERSTKKTTVPGCVGDSSGEDVDFCYNASWEATAAQPSAHTAQPSAHTALDSSYDDWTPPAQKLEKCHGWCGSRTQTGEEQDKDAFCAGNLKCFVRTGTEWVPGCAGTGVKNWGYCYDKDEADAMTKTALADSHSGWTPPTPRLQECQGWCGSKTQSGADQDADEFCAGELKCFIPSVTDNAGVPGCTGTGHAGWGYCHDPKWADPSTPSFVEHDGSKADCSKDGQANTLSDVRRLNER